MEGYSIQWRYIPSRATDIYIYRMPDGTLRLQCGNCGTLLPQLRILAGQRNGKFIPSRCPECGSAIVGVQGTEDWSDE